MLLWHRCAAQRVSFGFRFAPGGAFCIAFFEGPENDARLALVLAVITYCREFFVGRHRLGLEVAALRQQLAVFQRKQPPGEGVYIEGSTGHRMVL